jgi:hypothetical protein
MIGRIELITDEQRSLLEQLRTASVSDPSWIEKLPESPAKQQFLAGRSDFGDLGGSVPPDYRLYLALGRFRNALVIAEERRQPSPSLTKFIDRNGLHPFRMPAGKPGGTAGDPASSTRRSGG